MEIPLHRVKERVLVLWSDEPRKGAGWRVGPSERQVKIIGFIRVYGPVKSGDLAAMSKIPGQAVLKELTALVEKDLIKREGLRRRARNVLQ